MKKGKDIFILPIGDYVGRYQTSCLYVRGRTQYERKIGKNETKKGPPNEDCGERGHGEEIRSKVLEKGDGLDGKLPRTT